MTRMERICVYPGSFDPVTSGHMDIIRRSAVLFDRVIVAVLHNPAKSGTFPVEERMRLLRICCDRLSNVEISSFGGLLVDFVKQARACAVVRGLRAVTDFENEFMMAQVNHQVYPEYETLFMMTQPEHAYISSSVVRELASFGGDISAFVPAEILGEIERFYRQKSAE